MKYLKITAVAAFIFVNYLSFNPQNGGSILKLDGLTVMNAIACETVECWEGKTILCAEDATDWWIILKKCRVPTHSECEKDC